jgi:hypothetical protein
MAIKALTGLVPEWYTPSSEKEADNPARFKLKPLDSMQVVEIQNYHDEVKGAVKAEGLYRAFELSLVDWENVFDSQDRRLKPTRNNIKAIPVEIIAECGAHAITMSYLTEDDEKNS